MQISFQAPPRFGQRHDHEEIRVSVDLFVYGHGSLILAKLSALPRLLDDLRVLPRTAGKPD